MTRGKEAYNEYASAGAHYETSLVEESGTRSVIGRLSVSQVRPCIGDVYHRRKLRVPRPKLHGGHLRCTLAITKLQSKSMIRFHLVHSGSRIKRARQIGADGPRVCLDDRKRYQVLLP